MDARVSFVADSSVSRSASVPCVSARVASVDARVVWVSVKAAAVVSSVVCVSARVASVDARVSFAADRLFSVSVKEDWVEDSALCVSVS